MSFFHLEVHSSFSMLQGACSIDSLMKKASETGMSQLALTDLNNMCGAVKFIKTAEEYGIKPVTGAELSNNDQSAVVLAKNLNGYSRICEMITSLKLDKDKFDLISELKNCTNDIFILTDCEEVIRDVFPHRGLYIKMVHTGRNIQKLRNLFKLSRELKTPCVASNNVHFLTPKDFHLHKVFTGIRTNTTLSTLPENSYVSEECYLKSEEEMKKFFDSFPEALSNTAKIAEQCELELKLGELKFPVFPVEDGENEDTFLISRCMEGLRKRYINPSREVTKRLTHELDVVTKMGFSSYFLVVWDIVREATERRYPIIGRGSAANSLISYVLFLTNVDPIKYDLYFERFLNEERKSPPDIDIDFSWEDRDKIVEYVVHKYGKDRVATIGSFNTFGARSSFREIGKVMGLSTREINKISKKLPHSYMRDVDLLKEVLPGIKDMPVNDEPYCSIIRAAKALDGFPNHLSIHPGGLVLSPGPMTALLPLERAPKGITITQFDMYDVEELGLIKIDLLCQRSLAVFRDTMEAVALKEGAEPDIREPENTFDDTATREMIGRGDSIGCFYIESPAMRGLLKKLEVDSFEMLTAASSVIRPGVSSSGMAQQFIRRHRGMEKVSYLHPKMGELMKDTYGIMIYQEDVLKVCHHLAGMSYADADLLRRAMSGKMRSRKAVDVLTDKFMKGCSERGVKRNAAEEIWRQIKTFAQYSFCKAHSASYAQLSFQVAWLKSRYPAEFMTSVLSNMGGFYSTHVYVEEARRLGVDILPPDVNRSADNFILENGAIRIGLGFVKDLGRKARKSIKAERERKPFDSVTDLCWRVEVDVREVENLVLCGAFDFTGKTRPDLMWELKSSYPKKAKKARKSSLLGISRNHEVDIPDFPDYSLREKLEYEDEILGFPVSARMLEPFRPVAENCVGADSLNNFTGKEVSVAGFMAVRRRVATSKNKFMLFVTLWGLEGPVECTLFPPVFMKFGHNLDTKGPYVFRGKVENDSGHCTLTVKNVWEIDDYEKERYKDRTGRMVL